MLDIPIGYKLISDYITRKWNDVWYKTTTGRKFFSICKTVDEKWIVKPQNRLEEILFNNIRLQKVETYDYPLTIGTVSSSNCRYCDVAAEIFEHFVLKCDNSSSVANEIRKILTHESKTDKKRLDSSGEYSQDS